MTNEINVSEEVCSFVKEYKNDYCALKIILFFADHPYARFSELAIIHALNHDNGRVYIQRTLSNFVERGIIKTQIGSSVLLYSLPENVRRLVLELAKLVPHQRQLLVR